MRAVTLAPDLVVSRWFNTKVPLSLAALRGRVVLLHAFQMLCPGCVAHGTPQAERAHRMFRETDLTVIGWVGLIVPHLARFLVGPDFGRLIPTAAIMGGGYLLVIDTLARSAASVEIPLGILTAVIGTPFFILLLVRARKSWS